MSNEDIEILADLNLIAEIEQVAKREKFGKHVTLAQIDAFIALLRIRFIIITTKNNND